MGSLVGQTESNIRHALKIADAMSPCILMCDEVEKAISGVGASGSTDSGVSARLFGTLLTWLNDKTSDVYVVCTCNDISNLPPEFSRAERFDGVFFVELPGVQQRRAIWDIYVGMYGLDRTQPKPVDADWTGAEIKACCRLAALLDVPLAAAAQNVVPVARTASEAVANLRKWATGQCLSADMPGIYSANSESQTEQPRRRVRRDPSNN
jgi:SpoVK/Ycf46/Vps4 family AAA+-type ATPase